MQSYRLQKLNLPAFAVKFRYGYCLKSEIIGQESVYIVSVVVLIGNHPHHVWVVLGDNRPCEPDALVTDKAGMHVHLTLPDNLETHVVLCPGDIIRLPEMEVIVKSPEVYIPLVHQVVSTCLNGQYVKAVHVIDLPLTQPDECRDGTSQVKQSVHFEGSLAMMELCPRAELQAEFNGAAVERIDHLVKPKTEAVASVQPLCPGHKDLGEITVYLPVLLLIELCKRGLMHQLQPCVVKFGRKRCQRSLYHTKAGTSCKLGEAHDLELVTARELLRLVITLVFVNTFSQLIVWNKVHHLGENSLSCRHDESKLDIYNIHKNEFFIEKFTNRHNGLNINKLYRYIYFIPDSSVLINIFFMIIENSKIVKIHFVSFIFLYNVKDGKIQNTKDVFS